MEKQNLLKDIYCVDVLTSATQKPARIVTEEWTEADAVAYAMNMFKHNFVKIVAIRKVG